SCRRRPRRPTAGRPTRCPRSDEPMPESPLLIAECCQNHNGDREILKRMIHEATENGADYVKIQALYSWEVAYRERFEEGVVVDGEQRAIKRPYQAEVDRLS